MDIATLRRRPPGLVGASRATLGRDLLAGLSVWAVLVPEALAYATIAGVNPVLGRDVHEAPPGVGTRRHLAQREVRMGIDQRRELRAREPGRADDVDRAHPRSSAPTASRRAVTARSVTASISSSVRVRPGSAM